MRSLNAYKVAPLKVEMVELLRPVASAAATVERTDINVVASGDW